MRLKLQLLSKFRLSHAETDETIAMRSNGRILAYLAYKGDQPVDRKELLRVLWPEEQSSVAANRLRVALTRMRSGLGPVLIESSHGLSLDWNLISCDYHEVIESERDSRSNVATADELQALAALLPALSQTLFAFEDEPWQKEAREAWQAWAGGILLHLADLAHLLGDQHLTEKAVEAGLTHLPAEPKLWVHLLRLGDAQGQGDQALKRLQAAQKAYSIQDPVLSKWIEQIQQSQADVFSPQKPLTPDELEFAGSLIEVLIEKQPDLARQVLGSPETRTSAGRSPRLMHSLLLKVIENPAEHDLHWERCVARTIGLKAWLNDHQGVLTLAPGLLERTKEPLIQRAVWNAVGTAKSLIRDWPGAMEAIEQTILLAVQMQDEVDVCSSKGTKATCLWLQGHFEESLALFDETLPKLAQMRSERAEFERLIGLGHRAFIPVMQGDFATGREWLEDSMTQRQNSGLNVPAGLQTSCLAMVKTWLGEREGMTKLMHMGLIEAFQSESDRFRLISLEFCAGALIALGDPSYGWMILAKTDEWRKEILHPRAPAEEQLIKKLLEAASSPGPRLSLPSEVTPSRLGKLAIQRMAKLEEAALAFGKGKGSS